MPWESEPITLTLRRLDDGQTTADRDRFASVATAQILGGARAYISGFLNDGTRGPIHRRDWMDLAILLRNKHGVMHIESERHGEDKSYDTGPGELA